MLINDFGTLHNVDLTSFPLPHGYELIYTHLTPEGTVTISQNKQLLINPIDAVSFHQYVFGVNSAAELAKRFLHQRIESGSRTYRTQHTQLCDLYESRNLVLDAVYNLQHGYISKFKIV